MDAQPVPVEAALEYEPHTGESRQYWRDIILGLNDGLVSIFLLVTGVVGGGLSTSQVLLTAVAGAVAGAISMGSGEYLATKSQDEVLEAELDLERTHIRDHRPMEMAQLRAMLKEVGLAEGDMETVAEAFGRTDGTLLEAMKALEFGVVESERRSPSRAMWVSALTFLGGSMPPLVPFLFMSATGGGLMVASLLSALSLFVVGAMKTRVTRTNAVRSGFENLVVAGIGGLFAYGIGSLVEAAFR